MYLATDDPGVARNASEQYPDIPWIVQSINRDKYDTLLVTENNPLLASASASVEVWKDLWAMAQCDMVVGSFVSTLLQLAMEMQIARKGHFVPFTSVETPWHEPFMLGNGWKNAIVGAPGFGSNPCTCRLLNPPDERPRRCKCDRSNGYTSI